MKYQLQYGSKEIEYALEFTDRKTLGISVNPDLSVLVKAPLETAAHKITAIVEKKAPWILRQQSFFLTFYPKNTKRKFISGETHLYLGKQYKLKVEKGEIDEVKLKGSLLMITYSKKSVEVLLNQWYLQKARHHFTRIAQPLIASFQNLDVAPTEISLINMPTRWGSCTPKGKVILNPELIKAPKGCIEYVINHELCHLVHHNHSSKFLELQTRQMPDWEKWKGKLERLLA